MEKRFIMTAFGEDRPGIVADVTHLIYEHSCNLEDSTMTRLEDEFAMIFLCAGQGEHLEEELARACRRLEREKRIFVFLRAVTPQAKRQKWKGTLQTLTVEGIDHAGIVYRVSRYLADQQINIADLESRLKHSPDSGTAIYMIKMHVEIPEGTDMNMVRQDLAQIGDQLHVDILL